MQEFPRSRPTFPSPLTTVALGFSPSLLPGAFHRHDGPLRQKEENSKEPRLTRHRSLGSYIDPRVDSPPAGWFSSSVISRRRQVLSIFCPSLLQSRGLFPSGCLLILVRNPESLRYPVLHSGLLRKAGDISPCPCLTMGEISSPGAPPLVTAGSHAKAHDRHDLDGSRQLLAHFQGPGRSSWSTWWAEQELKEGELLCRLRIPLTTAPPCLGALCLLRALPIAASARP